MTHKPVLLGEAIECLNLKPGMTVVDGTLGAGGHSEAILEKILPGGKLISIDWDEKAIRNFEKKLREGVFIAKRKLILLDRPVPDNINRKNGEQLVPIFKKLGNRGDEIAGYWCGAVSNFSEIGEIIRGLGVKTVDAVFVDLGFSSDQIDDPKRGFSFLKNGPLDMRYSSDTEKRTAADIVNNYSERELSRIFKEYGEEKFAKRIAREIWKRRKTGEIRETGKLVEVISAAVPEIYKRKKIHFATRIFQALRIETNQELENLKKFLDQAVEILVSEGRLALISFHSLEDRIVKNFFRDAAKECVCPPVFPKCICAHRPILKIITKKPIFPGEDEIGENPRSRSAKLRVAQKI